MIVFIRAIDVDISLFRSRPRGSFAEELSEVRTSHLDFKCNYNVAVTGEDFACPYHRVEIRYIYI